MGGFSFVGYTERRLAQGRQEPVQTESFLHVDLKFNDGAQLLIHIPLGRSTEEREAIERVFGMILQSWAKAYHPDPCPLCRGTGDARQLPTLEELRRTSVPVDDIERGGPPLTRGPIRPRWGGRRRT